MVTSGGAMSPGGSNPAGFSLEKLIFRECYSTEKPCCSKSHRRRHFNLRAFFSLSSSFNFFGAEILGLIFSACFFAVTTLKKIFSDEEVAENIDDANASRWSLWSRGHGRIEEKMRERKRVEGKTWLHWNSSFFSSSLHQTEKRERLRATKLMLCPLCFLLWSGKLSSFFIFFLLCTTTTCHISLSFSLPLSGKSPLNWTREKKTLVEQIGFFLLLLPHGVRTNNTQHGKKREKKGVNWSSDSMNTHTRSLVHWLMVFRISQQ